MLHLSMCNYSLKQTDVYSQVRHRAAKLKGRDMIIGSKFKTTELHLCPVFLLYKVLFLTFKNILYEILGFLDKHCFEHLTRAKCLNALCNMSVTNIHAFSPPYF